MIRTMNSLNKALASGGYVSFNKETRDIEVKHNHFFGRLVVLARYTMSESYRVSVTRASRRLIDVMSNDTVYKNYFKDKVSRGMPDFLNGDKPISARQVRLFMEEIVTEANPQYKLAKQQIKSAKRNISRFTAHSGDELDRKVLNRRIDRILDEKIATLPTVEADDVSREGISEELHEAAMAGATDIKEMEDMDVAEKFVEEVLEGILDKRIAQAQADRQTVLKQRLSAAALPQDKQRKVESEIAELKIATEPELDSHVNDLVLQQINEQFDSLLEQACEGHDYDIDLLRSLHLEDSVSEYLLARADDKLSLDSASRHVVELLREHGQAKKEAAAEMVDKLTGKDGLAASREQFKQRLDDMFEAKIKDQPGLRKSNVSLHTIEEEVHRAATAELAKIANEDEANELIARVMSNAVDRRIAHGRVNLQQRLTEQLQSTQLSTRDSDAIQADIDSGKILSPSQLNERIIASALKIVSVELKRLPSAMKKLDLSIALPTDDEGEKKLLRELENNLKEKARYADPSLASARTELMQMLKQHKLDLIDTWVKRWSGMGGGDSRDVFNAELDKRLTDAPLASAIDVRNVQTAGLREQIYKEILEDSTSVAVIKNEEDAKAMVLNKLSALLAPRIEQANLDLQKELSLRLSAVGLSASDHRNLETAITDMQITTMGQLNRAIDQLVVKQVDAEFESLFKQVKDGYGFNEEVGSLSTVRAQVREQIAARHVTSVRATRDSAVKLLEQWLNTKAEALKAIQPSRYLGSDSLLKRLVLQEPYMTKVQVEEFQQAIEKTLDETYKRDPSAYDALGMDAQKIFSKLRQIERRDTLFNELRTQVQQAEKPNSVFDKETWHATNAAATVQNYMAALAEPLVQSYRQVEQLKEWVPQPIYETARAAVLNEGATWGEDFIGITNGLYIDTLKENNNAALYKLLESPRVGEQPLGAGPNRASLTFKDLVDSTIERKRDRNKQKVRQQAIDRLIPAEHRDYLLADMEHELSQIQDRVIDSSAANDLFQNRAINFLREAKIDFEAKKIDFNRRVMPTPKETTL